ncbi:MAG TPA: mechanosensitive ion channel domain-containing protein [Candidatus Binatia bacterium]|nr:mechanosensitive ion channel domain-containing protein [Candidatus Binatia bacterium]
MNVHTAAGSRRVRRFMLLVAGTVPWIVAATATHGQTPTVGSGATPTAIVSLSIAQIPEFVEQANNDLRAIRARSAADPRLAVVSNDLPELARQTERLGAETANEIGSGLTPSSLEDVSRQWRQYKDQLTAWAQLLGVSLQANEQDSARLGEIDGLWTRTEKQAQADNVPDAARAPIRTLRGAIRDAQLDLRRARDERLGMLGRVSSLQEEVNEKLAQLELAAQRLRRDLFAIDGEPLWAIVSQLPEESEVLDALAAGVRHDVELLATFLRWQRARVITHGLLIVLIAVITTTLSRRQRAALSDDTPAAVRTVLTRPISATLLLAAVLNLLLYRYAPVVAVDAAALVVAAVMVRLFPGDDEWVSRQIVLLMAVLFLLSAVGRLLPPLSVAARLMLVAEDVIAAAWLTAVLRSGRWQQSALARRWGVVAWVGLVIPAVSLFANCIGNVSLAFMLTGAMLRSAFSAFGLLAADRVIEGLLIEVIGSRAGLGLRSVANNAASLRRWLTRAVRMVMVAIWGYLTLDLFALQQPFITAATAFLTAQFTVGAATISVGGVVSVVLTVWVSLLVARLVRVVLAEDILPRLSLPRGVPAAISAGANYLVLLFGFAVALSAAGIDPGRVALVAGALSVGIGFGLQTVVNNFVSGLILLLERPIQLGDTIEIGPITGQVRHIGIRSSTIATFDGAEVIVPNATLISERVVNWTLSNFQRRIELTVGVAYGTDPRRVIEILERMAGDVADVLKQPAPQAVFVGFGASSLDFALRVWTTRQDILGLIRSRLGLAVHDALHAAGIEIPFPQREVRVRSVESAPEKPGGSN